MSTTLLSAFYDIDFFCKTEKSLSNMLDKKAVGSPVGTSPSSNFTPGFLRRHSTSNLQALANGNIKFPSASLSAPSNFGSLKEPGTGAGSSSSSTTALLNKENKFRDRSLSENGERSQHLMQQLHQQQVVVVAATSAGKGGGGGGGNGGGGGGNGGGGAPINSTRYKTELCRPFEESGSCKYGEKCQFAHGFHELRSLTRHPKYKTELCRTFHTIGFCPYGPRCHFIHNADERRPAPANGSANPPAAQQQPPPPPPPPLQPNPPPHSSHPSHHHHHHHHPPSLHPPHAGSTGDLRAFAPSARDHPLGPGGTNGTNFGIPHPRGGGERPKLHHSLSFSGFSAHQHHHHGGAVAQGGLEAAALLLESPGGSRTPPPPSSGSYCDDLVASCANNAFAFSAGQELGSLIAPLTLHPPPPSAPQQGCFANAATFYRCHQQQSAAGGGGGGGGSCCPPPGPPSSPPFSFQPLRRLSESPVFDAPPSPPDSLSDRESYLSGSLSSGSLSGSESPGLDSGRRLPIFSRLSISDD